MPATLLALAKSEGERLGVDPVGIATLAIGACSGVIDDNWRVRLKVQDSWTQSPRLWMAVVDYPGAKKTEQLNVAKASIDKIEAELRRKHATEMARYVELVEKWEAEPKKSRGKKPEPPARPRLTTQDATIEAISDMLKSGDEERQKKLLVVVDELASVLASFDRYNSGKGGSARADWLKLYEGGPHQVDRVVRGSVFCSNWSASTVGGIQPEKLRPMMKDLSTDGLLQRFGCVYPQKPANLSVDDDDKPSDYHVLHDYEQVVRCLWAMRPLPRDGGGFLEVRATQAGQPERRRLFRLIRRIEHDPTLPSALKQTASKWAGQLARLALVFHLIQLAEQDLEPDPFLPNSPGPDRVTLAPATIRMAANFILRVIAPSTFRLYRELGLDVDPHARWIAGFILSRKLTKISAYEIGHAYRELRGDIQGIIRAMDVLEHAGWASGDGHPKRPKWDISPRVHAVFAERAQQEENARAEAQKLLKQSIAELAT
jgi:hypothetical protein